VSTYDRLASLPMQIDGYELEGLEQAVSSGFTRRTTVIRLLGAGEEGLGEDVTYTSDDHALLQQGPTLPLAGVHTIESFSRLLDGLELFPSPPAMDASRHYRRWAFESAALDLGLRQAGRSLADALGRTAEPVRFVVSTRLGDEPGAALLSRLLERYPTLRFKLDPTSSWTDAVAREVAALGVVDVLDFKGAYRGTVVDQPADPSLYRRVAAIFPGAWLEDPDLTTPEADEALADHRERITWDAPIHAVADVEALPFPPRTLNVKPSRLGSVRELLALYDYCAARGIGMYGGGQFELGPGRGQIQYLAALFHADAPNDVAPGGFNSAPPPDGLATSPLQPPAERPGFRGPGPS
jgi:L-alanine-DL-glutamate epimerase-like enolase superfamily enzyme